MQTSLTVKSYSTNLRAYKLIDYHTKQNYPIHEQLTNISQQSKTDIEIQNNTTSLISPLHAPM